MVMVFKMQIKMFGLIISRDSPCPPNIAILLRTSKVLFCSIPLDLPTNFFPCTILVRFAFTMDTNLCHSPPLLLHQP